MHVWRTKTFAERSQQAVLNRVKATNWRLRAISMLGAEDKQRELSSERPD